MLEPMKAKGSFDREQKVVVKAYMGCFDEATITYTHRTRGSLVLPRGKDPGGDR